MIIRDGDVFQVMRMVLPEHRKAMNEWAKEQSCTSQPELLDDEYEAIQYTLSEALESGAIVHLTIFGAAGNCEMKGTLRLKTGALYITSDEAVKKIPLDKLIHVEIVR